MTNLNEYAQMRKDFPNMYLVVVRNDTKVRTTQVKDPRAAVVDELQNTAAEATGQTG